MTGDKADGVMDSLLSTSDDGDHPALEELNCLIYRRPEDAPVGGDEPDPDQPSWKASQDNITVQIWETKANIRIRVAGESRKHISMNKIAEIAVQAIMEELKKEAE